jgi:hypothetical protein
MNPKTISQVLEEFEIDFVPSSLKWRDAVHCTCCSTEEEYNNIKSFIKSSLEAILESCPLEEKEYQHIDNKFWNENATGYNNHIKEVKEWKINVLK